MIGQVPACGAVGTGHGRRRRTRGLQDLERRPQSKSAAQSNSWPSPGAIKENRRGTVSTADQPNRASRTIKPRARSTALRAISASSQSTLELEEEIIQDDRNSACSRHPPRAGRRVVGGIVPWNFPVMMAIQKIVPAMLSGCTIILKPSPFTPLTTLRHRRADRGQCGAGWRRQHHHGRRRSLGPMITAHPDIDKITFTGSTATGKKIMEGAIGKTSSASRWSLAETTLRS